MLAYTPTLALSESWVALYKIYVLKNPFTNEVFYVGQTKMELSTRLTGHVHESGVSNKPKYEYIQSMVDAGKRPIIEEIETISGTCYIDKMFVNEREIFWVKYFKSRGIKLLNSAIMHDTAECYEYKAYLKSIKVGESSYHYYYCGKTHAGYEVYDERKMKADGFCLPIPDPIPPKIIERIVERVVTVYIEKPAKRVKTEEFMPMPAWTSEFANSIPDPVDFMEDMVVDESDFEIDDDQEPASDLEPDSDFEPDIEENDEEEENEDDGDDETFNSHVDLL